MNKRMGTIIAGTTLAVGGVAGVLALGTHRADAAGVYHVVNSGIGVAYRNSPRADDKKQPVHGAYDGWTITVLCQGWGDAMGPRSNRVWDYIQDKNNENAWIPDAWVDTPAPANQLSMGLCGSTPTPAPATPPPSATPKADTAVTWARQYLGTNFDAGLCLRFVYDAWRAAGVDIGRSASAASWAGAHRAQLRTDGTPPKGALVFWWGTAGYPDGHVALSQGDGTAVSTDERSFHSVHVMSIADRSKTRPYAGWYLPG